MLLPAACFVELTAFLSLMFNFPIFCLHLSLFTSALFPKSFVYIDLQTLVKF